MRRFVLSPFGLVLAALVLVSSAATADSHDTVEPEPELVQDQTTFFVNWRECGAASQHLLETVPGPNNGCGPAGGIPLGEALAAAGDSYTQTYSTVAGDGVPLLFDVSEDIEGEIHIQSWTGLVGAGAGQVVVNGELFVQYVHPTTNRLTSASLGTFSGEQIATPQKSTVVFPFTFDIDDEKYDGVEVRGMSLDLEVRGVFANSGVQASGGKSKMTVPTLVDPAIFEDEIVQEEQE